MEQDQKCKSRLYHAINAKADMTRFACEIFQSGMLAEARCKVEMNGGWTRQ